MCFLLWQKRILRFAFPVGSEELRRGNGAMRFSVRSFGYALFYFTQKEGKQMALHRCAVCGSPNVVTDVQAGGVSYNYKKGIVGTIVLGAGGAVAGIESKNQQIFKCRDCGNTLTYEMPESLRNAIDRGLISEDARSFLYADGYGRLSWSVLRKQYKNIEEGFADRLIADCNTGRI